MNGVEILNSVEVYEKSMCWWMLLVFLGIGLIIGITMLVFLAIKYGFIEGSDIMNALMVVVIFLGAGFVITSTTIHETDTVDHIEYKVTIDDSVPMNEFYEKYEILDQEGKIYTVKERE